MAKPAGPANDIAYAGVVPLRLFDTSTKQDTSTSKGAGICMAMSCDWVAKNKELGRVSSASQLESAHNLGIAQSAHEIGHLQSDEAIMERFGLTPVAKGTVGAKWYTGKKKKFNEAAQAIAGWHGYNIIGILGKTSGGHAMAARFEATGIREFFDPNEGLLTFGSSKDFIKWFPAYIVGDYPDLTNECEVYTVR